MGGGELFEILKNNFCSQRKKIIFVKNKASAKPPVFKNGGGGGRFLPYRYDHLKQKEKKLGESKKFAVLEEGGESANQYLF